MKTLFVLLALPLALAAQAQQLVTRNGYIGFFSKTPLEDIRGESNQAAAALDVKNSKLVFAVLMKGFLFPKELMQEHFNENYVESDKYPKATFSGVFAPAADVTKAGTYNVTVTGNLTLHGVTRPVSMPATITTTAGAITSTATFLVVPQEYNISIPALVREKIAKQITVSVNAVFKNVP